MARRTVWLLLAALVAAFTAGLGVVLVTTGPDCPVALAETDTGTPELVRAEDLAPEGSVGEERRPVIEAMEGLGGPFGGVVAGRFYETGDPVPVLVPFGTDVVLAGAQESGGDFRAVALPEGTLAWGREYDEGPARGGLVGDDFVVLVGGPTPALVALDSADGDERGCVAVPVGGEAGDVDVLLTDQAGTDVVVLAGRPAAPMTLSRIDPRAGELRWDRELDGVAQAGSVTAFSGDVVVSRVADDPVRLADMAAAGGIGAPMVTAYSLDDGSAAWTYPAAERSATTAASVVGSDADSGVLLVLTVAPGRSRSAKATVARLVALGPDGNQLWATRLGDGYWNASLWGRQVVAQGPGRRGGAQLRAFDAGDGRPAWSLQSTSLPSSGDQPRTNFGSAVAVGDGYVVPAPNGLVRVDPATGAFDRLDSPVAVDKVLVAGDLALVSTKQALLVLDLVG